MSSLPSSRRRSSALGSLPQRTLTAPRLPPELVDHVLSHLPQRDLRHAALASQAFYAHALHAGLHVRINCDWGVFRQYHFERALDKLDRVLAHAPPHRALNTIIHAAVDPPQFNRQSADCQDAINRLGPRIRRALPKLLHVSCTFAHLDADPLFCMQPAPKLRALNLTDHRTDVPVVVPPALFNGVAPKLRKLALVLTDTDSMSAWLPIAVFRGVTHLKLAAKSVPRRLRLAPLCPALRVLVIDATDAPETRTIDLRGLTLRHFAFAGNIKLLDDASIELLKSIPIVEHRTDDVSAESIWPANSGELCAFSERCGGDPGISLGPRDGSWRRTIVSTYLQKGALPLKDIPTLGATLVSLTVNESLVTAFVQAHIVLAHLRELTIDVSTARGRYEPFDRLHHAVPCVRCPALKRLVLLCIPEPDAFSVRVSPDKVVRLGRGLNMRDARPAVVLAGCAWRSIPFPPTDTELLQLFSNQGAEESVDANMPDYYDTCRYSGYFDTQEWD